MMQQFMEQKRKHRDCLLLFRMGDFFELFLDDAIVAADILNITLTQRAKGRDGEVPMAGVPHHALDTYLSKLVSAGYRVAICDQVTEADNTSNLVEREVIRIVTPGTLLDENTLSAKRHNFSASIAIDTEAERITIACADLSTGDLFVQSQQLASDHTAQLSALLEQHRPREVIYSPDQAETMAFVLERHDEILHSPHADWDDHAKRSDDIINSAFRTTNLEGLGLAEFPWERSTTAALLGYLKNTQKDTKLNFSHLHRDTELDAVALDRSTMLNLELFETIRQGRESGSFIHVFDHTRTAMGGRLLRRWIQRPLLDLTAIEDRLDAVSWYLEHRAFWQDLLDQLDNIGDIERILRSLQLGTGTPPTVIRLKQALSNALDCGRAFRDYKAGATAPDLLSTQIESLSDDIESVVALIETKISDDPPHDAAKGGVFKEGVHDELDELMQTIQTSKDWIQELQRSQREQTGIQSLKVDSNKVHGYYIEISKANLEAVPDNYERRQTLVNAERFITPELKEHEAIIIEHQELAQSIEKRLFAELLEEINATAPAIKSAAQAIAHLDALSSHATLAQQPGYTRPKLVTEPLLDIKQGRHPVVAAQLGSGSFVPNDTLLSSKDHNLNVVTGPNMAGKSVYMRQSALITLMAHVGAYVPAESATIGIVDRIFVRSGAADSITSGLSTFMVEMTEAAYILNNLTERSLLIFDEIGRGTSTFDGISIAWAIAQELVSEDKPHPRTLFATHYHELQSLASVFPERVKNIHLLIDEESDTEGPRFLHVVVAGAAPHSFGVAVAKRAGIPPTVTKTAEELLETLEHADYTQQFSQQVQEMLQSHATDSNTESSDAARNYDETRDVAAVANAANPSHPVFQELSDLEINHLTPLEALQVLDRLHSQARKITQKSQS